MMRRLLLSSAKPHQPHHHHHHHHNSIGHENGQERLPGSEEVSPNAAPVRGAGQEDPPPTIQSYRVSRKKIRFGRSLARTNSETDLIRAMAKKANKKKKKKKSSSSEDSEDSSSEDESRHATSLRSFTKEDEERSALASWNKAFRTGLFSKIGEEEEQSSTLKSTTSHHDEEVEAGTETVPTTTGSGSASTKQSAASEVSAQDPELKSASPPNAVSHLEDGDAKTQLGSDSGNESTSVTELENCEVDVEYLLHENDLLRNSLEHVVQDRDYLAQDNWNLRMELENLRNQMRFLMTASGSPVMYNAPTRAIYPAGSAASYVDTRSMNLAHRDPAAYAQYGQSWAKTFED